MTASCALASYPSFRDDSHVRNPSNLILTRYSSSTRTLSLHHGFSPRRVSYDVGGEGKQFRSRNRIRNTPKRYSFFFREDVVSSSKHQCITCSHNQYGRTSGFKGLTSRVFVEKSTFHFSKQTINNVFAKQLHVPYATMGPDEPHVVSTTCPDTIFENQGSNLLDFEVEHSKIAGFLKSELPSHPKVYRAQLKNGLRYVIVPNKVPANRFEAHMEIHAGSIDEADDEQGIAHMIEHVAFLGSAKRERLLGTGCRSNAYTDFHHTVFHIHSPSNPKDSDEDLLPRVLDALNEIAFHPKFISSRVEKERRAILSELQMMNTIEYRVDCQLLQNLHSENKLGRRFPIGLEEQIKKWDVDQIRMFHERLYFPANATLYIVGDIDDISNTPHLIEAVFGHTEPIAAPNPSPFGAMASFLVPKFSVGLSRNLSHDRSSLSENHCKLIKKERDSVRPPVEHIWSSSGRSDVPESPQIFQHELIQNFSISMFSKIPVNKVRTYGDLRIVLMNKIFLSALHFRVNTRYKSSDPPFISIEMDHSDSGREGCTVTTLTVTAEPKNWHGAIKVAVQEIHRLKEFGVTRGELTRYTDAVLKDSEQLAAMIDNVPSVNTLDFIMENDALGHTVMDQKQGHESLVAAAGTITFDEVNSTGARLLEFISDFGKPRAPHPAAIVACIPKKVHIEGTGETEFKILSSEIADAIKSGLDEPIVAEPELDVPKELISAAKLQELKLQRSPSFVPINSELNATKVYDEETGITQRHLSNGIRVNYKISQTEAWGGVMRVVIGGGRALESPETSGAVVVGVRTLSESGRVGDFSREQVELFCVNHMINCSMESTEEFTCVEFRFSLRDKGMQAAFQLLHMVLEHSVWTDDALDRAKQLYLSFYRSIPKSLERSTAHKLMTAMLLGDERFLEPTPKSLQNLTLQSVKDAVLNQIVGGNMELSIVGDFSEDEIESCILDYMGTIGTTREFKKDVKSNPMMFRPSPSDLQFQQVFLKDTDERACAYIAGPALNRWGFTIEGKDMFRTINNLSSSENVRSKLRRHPLFFGIALSLMSEIINSRLFTTVRDSLGLTYDVSFALSLFDRLHLGWYVISVTSTPSKVYKAVDACKNVLWGLHDNEISQRELDRAKRTVLLKHDAELKSNVYWLGLIAHLQASSVPRKDITSIKDLITLYEAATIEDVYLAYEQLKIDENSLYSCIGIAGAQAGDEVFGHVTEEQVLDEGLQEFLPIGRGLSTITRPTA